MWSSQQQQYSTLLFGSTNNININNSVNNNHNNHHHHHVGFHNTNYNIKNDNGIRWKEQEQEQEQQQQCPKHEQQQDQEEVVYCDNNEKEVLLLSNIPSLVCALLSASCIGTNYAFGIYSLTLQENLRLSQNNIDTISTCIFVGGIFCWIPGIFTDRLGTRISLICGGFISAISLLLYWCIGRGFVDILGNNQTFVVVPILSILGLMNFLSSNLIVGSAFKIIMTTCGGGGGCNTTTTTTTTTIQQGTIVGISKGYIGLAAGIYTCIFRSIQGTKNESDLDSLPTVIIMSFCSTIIPAILLLPTARKPTVSVCLFYNDDITWLHCIVLYCSLIIPACIVIGDATITSRRGDRQR